MRDVAERKNIMVGCMLRMDQDLATCGVGEPSPMAWLSGVLFLSQKDVEMKGMYMRTGGVAELGNTRHGVTQPELIKVSGMCLSSMREKPQVLFTLTKSC